MKKFTVGQELSTRFACDYDSVLTGEVLSRTEKTVTIKIHVFNKIKRCKIYNYDTTRETILPLGNYSMSPSFKA